MIWAIIVVSVKTKSLGVLVSRWWRQEWHLLASSNKASSNRSNSLVGSVDCDCSEVDRQWYKEANVVQFKLDKRREEEEASERSRGQCHKVSAIQRLRYKKAQEI